MKKILIVIGIAALAIFSACNNKDKNSDAYGNFEAEERIISPEIPGKIVFFDAEEGTVVDQGDTLAIIDTTDLILKVAVLQAQKEAVRTKLLSTHAQTAVYEQQKENSLAELKRFKRMLEDKAATSKQVDDLEAAIKVLERQINATGVSGISIESEIRTIERQIDQTRENIRKCYLLSPIRGTLTEKYAEAGEVALGNKNLMKIADLEHMYLRVYVSGDQLPEVKTGAEVGVFVDKNERENTPLKGVISWISSTAEFTPKIIQTKKERVNLVYAVKVRVDNPEGLIKIGMPGEIRLKP